MKIPISITISKPQGGRDGQRMAVRLKDKVSGICFFDGEFSLHDFMDAITGMAEVAGSGEVRGLENLGKTKISEPRSILCPLRHASTHQFEEWLKEFANEDGWILDSYLGRQGSKSGEGDSTRLNYSVHKYVEAQP